MARTHTWRVDNGEVGAVLVLDAHLQGAGAGFRVQGIMGAWHHGGMASWGHGIMGLRVQVSMGFRVQGSMGRRV